MRYSTVLLDLDNTVLDFTAAQREAFFRCFPEMGETLFQTFETINRANWRRLERREATRAEILHNRFAEFFSAIGMQGDADEANARYLEMLSRVNTPIPGAPETVRALSGLVNLAVVTNGVTTVQERRLAESGLRPYFRAVVVSEEVGCDKPNPRIFQEALRRCGEEAPEKALVIGDSLTADIAGGMAAGIDTCWYQPDKAAVADFILPTYRTCSPAEWLPLITG